MSVLDPRLAKLGSFDRQKHAGTVRRETNNSTTCVSSTVESQTHRGPRDPSSLASQPLCHNTDSGLTMSVPVLHVVQQEDNPTVPAVVVDPKPVVEQRERVSAVSDNQMTKNISKSARVLPVQPVTGRICGIDESLLKRTSRMGVEPSKQSLRDLHEVFKTRRLESQLSNSKHKQKPDDMPGSSVSNDVSMLLGMSVAERSQSRPKLNFAQDLKITSFFKHFEERQKSREKSKDLLQIGHVVPPHVGAKEFQSKVSSQLRQSADRQLLQNMLTKNLAQINTEAYTGNNSIRKFKTELDMAGQRNRFAPAATLLPKQSQLSQLTKESPIEKQQERVTARNLAGDCLLSSRTNLLDMAHTAKSRSILKHTTGESIIDFGLQFKAAVPKAARELFKLPSGDFTARTSQALRTRTNNTISQLNSMYDAQDRAIQARSIERISRIRMKITDSR